MLIPTLPNNSLAFNLMSLIIRIRKAVRLLHTLDHLVVYDAFFNETRRQDPFSPAQFGLHHRTHSPFLFIILILIYHLDPPSLNQFPFRKKIITSFVLSFGKWFRHLILGRTRPLRRSKPLA